MYRFGFSVWVKSAVLWAGMVLCGVCSARAQAQERPLDTVHLFTDHADTVWLGFDDTLHISAGDKDDAFYAYHWDVNGKDTGEDDYVLDFPFTGQRKNKITGNRVSPSSRVYHFDITLPAEPNTIFLDAIDTACLTAFPEYKDSSVSWTWSVMIDDGTYHTTVIPGGPQFCLTKKFEWGSLVEDWLDKNLVVDVVIEGIGIYKTASVRIRFVGETGKSIYLPENKDEHSYHFNVFRFDFDRIYAHPNDTLYLDAQWGPDEISENPSFSTRYQWESTTLTEEELNDRYSPSQIVFFRGERYRDNLAAQRRFYIDDTLVFWNKCFYIYWGLAEIETDSVWVFFPQYPYSNLGGRVDICWPPDASLPTAEDTIQMFNLGPWNRELEYVEYAWLDGTKNASGRDSVVGTDSAFAYLFGRMDSVSPELYTGTLVTRVAADSLWQDSCDCFVPCTDDACHRYDTVRIYLHVFPSQKQNLFLPYDTTLCAHQDLELFLPKADAYRCYWLDKDSVALPYGYDTARYTVQGMRGLDGYGAGTDTREPRFFQLRLDHKLCGVSFFDTLLVYDQVKPVFELTCHDTLICLDEPVKIDSLSPHVYRPFYNFEWNDGKKGSAYTFTDSGVYVLQFFVGKDFSVCGYDTAFDTIRVWWSDPAQTLITLGDTSFCEKLSVTLDARVPCPTTLYCWQDGPIPDPEEDFGDETDSIIFSSVSVKVFKEEGTYNISLLDTMGCINRKEIAITIDDCSPKLDIPNVFTPNGDGVNDVWKFKQLEKCTDVKVEVVDRWGQPVLKQKVASAENFEWNGTMNNNGRRLPDGPYFYMVSYKDVYGKSKVQSGSITILGTAE